MKRALAVLLALVAVTALAALPGSGAISFSMIQTEFGGSNPIAFSEYYRNGGLVPTNGTTGSIATSGAINVNTFHGAAASGSPSLSTTGTAGTDGLTNTGFQAGNFGSMVSVTTSDGKTVTNWYTSSLPVASFVEVSGFGADPGQTGWATNFIINGSTKTAASANVYGYSAGVATWRFNTSPWAFVNGVGFTAVIN